MSYAEFQDQKLARKNRGIVALVSFLFPPAGYWMVGRKGLALFCLLTFGFLFTGILLVPLHTWLIIGGARERDLARSATESSA